MYIHFTCPPLPHLIVGGMSIYRKGDRHERRMIHNTFDLIYVREGVLYMEEKGKQFTVQEGEFLILVPERTHMGYRHCTEDTVFSWVHFYTEGAFSYSDAPAVNLSDKMNKNKYYQKEQFHVSLPQFGLIPEGYREKLLGYLDQISLVKIDRYNQQKLFFDSVSSQIEYQILFMNILALICSCNDQPREKTLAEEIYEYLCANYRQPFSLTELSRQFSFHPAYITRCIKKKYQLTPLQLLTRIRIEEAQKLLGTTQLHVNIIGENVGYSAPAYFSKQFKKVTGMTALEYRLNHERHVY